MATRRRLDAELVRRELAESRSQAHALIDAHQVRINGTFADNAARLVAPGDHVALAGEPPRFVGRGGQKLDGALAAFGVDVHGLRCLDAGASTGGFTDCLLQAGAATVIAVDVGYGQLHESLVSSGSVTNLERTNIRTLTTDDVGGPVDLVVGDLSFISLTTVMSSLMALVREGGELILLVKPQFEASRQEASRGRGVIRDAAVWRRVLDEVIASAEQHGAHLLAATTSPIRGGDGNVEFLVYLGVGRSGVEVDLDALVDSVC